MSGRESKEDKLGELLKGLPHEAPGKDFDEKFWKRFELEKDLPPPAGRPEFGPVPVLTAVLLALAFVSYALLARTDRPSVRISEGAVQSSVPVGQKLKTGDSIRTGASGWVLIELDHAYRLKVQPESEIVLENPKQGSLPSKTVFYLSKGQALVSIHTERHAKYPLEIRTPHAFAHALGTEFIVDSSPSMAQSSIAVLRGTVAVGSAAKNGRISPPPVHVQAGQQARVAGNQAPETPQTIVETERKKFEEWFQLGRRNQVILLISMSAGRVNELLKPCALYLRLESANPASRAVESVIEDIRSASENKDLGRHLTSIEKLEKLTSGENDLDPVSLLLFTGAYYDYLDQPAQAVRVFEKVVSDYPNSQYRSLALAAAALICEQKLHSPEKAVSLAQQILTQYPESYEAPKAAELVERNHA